MLCLLPVVQLEVRYVKLYFTTFRWHTILQVLRLFSTHENEILKFGLSYIILAKYEKVASVTIMLYTLAKRPPSLKRTL